MTRAMKPRAVESRLIDGIVLVDKPAGMTSHDVVSTARRALRTRRIGHAGTLDPFATGLLVLLVGHATRLLPYVHGEPKVYDAVVAFGPETDTDDVTGTVLRTAAPPEPDAVRRAIDALTGEIEQVPPAYSAKHVAGRRAYQLARRGDVVDLAPTKVCVNAWEIHELTPDHLAVTITCGGGTYIRALARDVGRLSGSAAHLASLRRTRSGVFDVAHADSWQALAAGAVNVRPPRDAVPHLPTVVLAPEDVAHVRHGRMVGGGEPLASSVTATTAALVDGEQRLVAIAERTGDGWQPRVVLPDA